VHGVAATSAAAFATRPLRGRVVWLADALKRRFDVAVVPEARERMLGFESNDGTLYPLVEDVRGRSFRLDERLRERDVELLVRQHEGSPAIQVVRVFTVRGGNKFELEYWCEICAIASYELKPCACCQGTLELRERRSE
jgi:hypothetical protein